MAFSYCVNADKTNSMWVSFFFVETPNRRFTSLIDIRYETVVEKRTPFEQVSKLKAYSRLCTGVKITSAFIMIISFNYSQNFEIEPLNNRSIVEFHQHWDSFNESKSLEFSVNIQITVCYKIIERRGEDKWLSKCKTNIHR